MAVISETKFSQCFLFHRQVSMDELYHSFVSLNLCEGEEDKKLFQTYKTFYERLSKNSANTDKKNEAFLGQLRKLEKELEKCSFIGGNDLALLDLYVFSILYSCSFFNLKRDEYNQVPCVARWYDHMQYFLRKEMEEKKHQRLTLDLEPMKVEVKKKEEKKKEQPKKEEKKKEQPKKEEKKKDQNEKKQINPEDLYPLLGMLLLLL